MVPSYYWGKASSVGGTAIPENKTVSVTVNGASPAYLRTTTVDALGRYGYAGGSGTFWVPGDPYGLEGAKAGDAIQFYVQGAKARLFDVKAGKFINSVTYAYMSNLEVNLTTAVITSTTTAGGNIDPKGLVIVGWEADQVFKMTPEAGYKVKDVLVDGQSVGATSVYTFTKVIADHTIHVKFGQMKVYLPLISR